MRLVFLQGRGINPNNISYISANVLDARESYIYFVGKEYSVRFFGTPEELTRQINNLLVSAGA